MKKFIKVISLSLVIAILFSCVAYAGSGFAFTQDERDYTASQWEVYQADETVITLSVGAEAGSISFSWLSGIADGKQKIKISESEDMANAEELKVKSSVTLFAKMSNKATAENLEEGKTYWYSYTEKGQWSEAESFKIQPKDNYTAIFVSDSQIGRSGDADNLDVLINDTCGWQRTVRMATERYPDTAFIISSGDQTEHGFSLTQYKAFLSPEQLRSYPLVNAIGNHDFYFPAYTYYSNNPNTVKELLGMPAGDGYYFCYGDALYIILDSNNFFAPDQSKLIKSAINAYPDAKWRIAILHHSAYSADYDQDDFAFDRSVYAPLFDAYDIDLALSGHDHMYSCTFPVYAGEVNENGTVYLQASSSSGSNIHSANANLDVIRYAFNEEIPTYTALEFKDGGLTINTYRTDSDEVIDTVTLEKSEKQEKSSINVFIEWIKCFFKVFSSMM